MHHESLEDCLRFAIAQKRLIQFTYLGARRVAEPHDYGIQKGRPRLLVYQLRGSTSSARSRVKGWKLLDVPKLADCVVLDETFPGSRGHAHLHHYTWDIVYARVT
jgi:hypothetical protein